MINKIKSVLHKAINSIVLYKIRDYEGIDGFLAPVEAVELYKIASKLPKHSVIVEIGSWKGKSTYCLTIGLKKGKVIAIDPFDFSGDEASAKVYAQTKGNDLLINQFEATMMKLGVRDKIEIFKGLSGDFIGKIPQINFLFIDGDHSKDGCDFDFINYSPYLSKGGYIALHDFDPRRKELGPTWVVENRILPSKDFEFVDLVGSLWIGRKK